MEPQSSGIEIKPKVAAALMKRWSALAKPAPPKQPYSSKPLLVEPARNLIFFGPPGTGKTHSLRSRLSMYEESISKLTLAEWLGVNVEDAAWWQVLLWRYMCWMAKRVLTSSLSMIIFSPRLSSERVIAV